MIFTQVLKEQVDVVFRMFLEEMLAWVFFFVVFILTFSYSTVIEMKALIQRERVSTSVQLDEHY